MIPRIVRIVSSLAVVLAAYWIYVLLAIPLIEPTVRKPPPIPPRDPNGPTVPGSNPRLEKLKELFGADDRRLKNPKIIETDRVMMLFQDYHNQEDGNVELRPCTIIFFSGDQVTKQKTRQPIVIQAPEGAILRFDEPLDPSRAKIGKLEAGRLKGHITIERKPSSPKANDGLKIETFDVQLTADRIWTPHEVKFRLGTSYGSGKDMRIDLLPNVQKPGNKYGPSIGGIKSFELAHNVSVHFQTREAKLFPVASSKTATGAKSKQRPTGKTASNGSSEKPIEITCKGPFRFDLVNNIASFEEHVDVMQTYPQGQSDQMLCELLTLWFVPRKTDSSSDSSGTHSEVPPLDLEMIEAKGDPVVIRSPSNKGHAQCQKLVYNLKENRLTMTGIGGIILSQVDREIHAKGLDYRMAEPGRLGKLLASGPGWLRANVGHAKNQSFQAKWATRLHIRPYKKNHVVSLMGRAEARMSGEGSIAADEIHLYLIETKVKNHPGPKRKNQTKKNQAGYQPEGLTALGNVRFDSPKLSGTTSDLIVWFDKAFNSLQGVRSTRRSPPRTIAAASRSTAAPKDPRQNDRFSIHGDRLRVQIVLGEKKPGEPNLTEVAKVTAEGNVTFDEIQLSKPDSKPLSVKGDLLDIVQANSPNMNVTIEGKPAHVEARGLEMTGSNIHLNRGTNELWINGDGQMTLPVNRDLEGHTLTRPESLVVSWQGNMTFDGQAMRFVRSVVARREHQILRTNDLTVTLTRGFKFSDRPRKENIDIKQIQCQGGVWMQVDKMDERGHLAQRMWTSARNLTINNTTGDLVASGPGWVKAVRHGSSRRSMFNLSPTTQRPPKGKTQTPKELMYSKILFQQSLTGNIHKRKREMTFHEQVKATYGPIRSWQDQLDGETLVSSGKRGIYLTCQELTVSQIGPARKGRRPIELAASGNVCVQSSTFTALASRLTYAEAKDLLILDSDGAGDAQLIRQETKGRSVISARQIHYWPSTKRFKVFSARSVQAVDGS